MKMHFRFRFIPPLVVGFVYCCLMVLISCIKQFFLIAQYEVLSFTMLKFVLITFGKGLLLLVGAGAIYCFREIDFMYEDDGYKLRCGLEIEMRDLNEDQKPEETSNQEMNRENEVAEKKQNQP